MAPGRFREDSDETDYNFDHPLHTTSRSPSSSSSSENDSGSSESSHYSDIGGEREVPYLKEASADTVLKLIELCLMYNPNFSRNGDFSIERLYETLDSIPPELVEEILEDGTSDSQQSESAEENVDYSDAAGASIGDEGNRHEKGEGEEYYRQEQVEQNGGGKQS